VAARLRHRDLRGARLRLRPRGDDVDPGGRAALRGAAPQDHPRADPGRGPPLPRPRQLRAARLRAEGGRGPMSARRRLLPALLALLLLLAAAPAGAETLTVTRSRLPNGLTVLVRENATAPVVAISLMVQMRTRWETPDNAGISNLVQIMAVRGTPTRTGIQIVEQADAMGGSIEATGDVDASEIAATALSRHWAAMLELVADVALHPTMPEGILNAVRDFLLRQIRNRGDKPYDVAFDTMTARLFGRHPYAWDPIGLKESLERLDRPALLAHYRRHYVPGGMVLAVSGRVKTAEVLAQARRLFGEMP